MLEANGRLYKIFPPGKSWQNVYTKQTHNVVGTSLQRRYNVTTLLRRSMFAGLGVTLT